MQKTGNMTATLAHRLVARRLADHGFGGHIHAETVSDRGEVTLTVTRGERAVPWTDHVHAWLKDVLAGTMGRPRVTAPNSQTVTLTWERS